MYLFLPVKILQTLFRAKRNVLPLALRTFVAVFLRVDTYRFDRLPTIFAVIRHVSPFRIEIGLAFFKSRNVHQIVIAHADTQKRICGNSTKKTEKTKKKILSKSISRGLDRTEKLIENLSEKPLAVSGRYVLLFRYFLVQLAFSLA